MPPRSPNMRSPTLGQVQPSQERAPDEALADDKEPGEGENGKHGEEDSDRQRILARTPGWYISVGVHLLFALIFWCAVWGVTKTEIKLPPMLVTAIDAPPEPEEKRKEERASDTEAELPLTTEAEIATPISPLDVPVDVEEEVRIEEDTTDHQAKVRDDAVSPVETGAHGAFMSIGAGGDSAGMFGNRYGSGKRRALARGGGTLASESAVNAALRWFKRHQSPDGMWHAEQYAANCNEMPKCDPGMNDVHSRTEVALTGYAVLCFLGAGHDHMTPNKYKATVEKGIAYLCSIQTASGDLGPRNYEHAVATMALAEAYAMTNDPALKTPAQLGLDVLVARQIKDAKVDTDYGGLGWDYIGPEHGRNDASVTGWCVMALKSGLAGGLKVGNSMDGAKKWLRRAWKASNPEWKKLTDPYKDTSRFHYTWDAVTDLPEGNDQLAPVGALCAVFLGIPNGDTMFESLCNYIMRNQVPRQYPCNTYYMYYNTLAIFQAGGERFKVWNTSVRDLLVDAQRSDDGCFNGSWDHWGTEFHGHDVGRVLSTAYCCLSLEVYYRYKQGGGK